MPTKKKKLVNFNYKLSKKEAITYVEIISVFILVLLAAFILVLAGVGFMLPDEYFLQVLTNIIATFCLAEGIIIIILLHRIYREK